MRVLVTTAGKRGATEEISARIGDVLRRRGHVVDVRCPGDVREVDDYDVVVLGSAIAAGHWRPEAKQLVEREQNTLATRPVWLFSNGPVGEPPMPAEDPAEAADLVAAVGAYDHHVFAEKIGKTELSRPDAGRGWDEVDWWATSIADSISSG